MSHYERTTEDEGGFVRLYRTQRLFAGHISQIYFYILIQVTNLSQKPKSGREGLDRFVWLRTGSSELSGSIEGTEFLDYQSKR